MQNDLPALLLFLAIVVSCGIAFLRFQVRSAHSPIIYFPLVPFALYIIWEILMQTKYPEVNVRFDIVVIGPLLAGALSRSCSRWAQAGGTVISGLSVSSFVTGLLGLVVPLVVNVLFRFGVGAMLFVSLIAVISGHRALRQPEPSSGSGREVAWVGLILGYLGLFSTLVFIPFLVLEVL